MNLSDLKDELTHNRNLHPNQTADVSDLNIFIIHCYNVMSLDIHHRQRYERKTLLYHDYLDC
jgi:hypothetical protein